MNCRELNVSRETMERLELFHKLLTRWQKKTNLVSTSTLEEFWTRHVIDSIQCLDLKPHVLDWADIGSGGGFPGLVIAIALADNEDTMVRLIESNNKKCAFLRAVIRETGARAAVLSSRAEAVIVGSNPPEIVCARAVTSLSALLQICEPWLSAKSTGLFHKGRNFRLELEETHDKWRFDLIEHQSRVIPESVILEISNLARLY